MIRNTTALLLVAGILTSSPASPALAQPFSFRILADSATPIPNGSGNFGGLSGDGFVAPSIGDQRVSFLGRGSAGQQGIYSWETGDLSRVADLNTTVPGTSNKFSSFAGATATSSDSVGFTGSNTLVPAFGGVYYSFAGALDRAADRNTAIPGGTGTFTQLSSGSVLGSSVLFYGRGSGSQRGLYHRTDSGLVARANTNTAVPGGTGTFTDFDYTSRLRGDAFAFHGFGAPAQEGIYLTTGAAPSLVVDKNTARPGGGSFSDFGLIAPSLDSNGDVAFYAGNGNSPGVYLFSGGSTSALVSAGDPAPGGTTFSYFDQFSYDSGRLLFEAFVDGAGVSSIYLRDRDASISLIAGPGTTINGHGVTDVNLGPQSLFGDVGVFYAKGFPYEAIVAVTIPAPGSLLLLSLATLRLARPRR